MSGNEREGLRAEIVSILKRIPENESAWERGTEDLVSEEAWADRILSLLTQAQEPVGYVVRLNPSAGSPLPWMFRERGQQLPPSNDGWEVVPVYTEPVNASPVASAPCREDEAQAVGAMGATHDAHQQLADVAGRMKVYGYDAETLRVLTDHILGGAEIPMPSAPEPYDASKEPIALNFLDNIFDCWKMGGDALDRFMRAQRRQIEDVLASAPVWPEPGAPAPATKPPLGKIRPSAPEEEREAGWKPDPCGICGGKRVTIRGQYPGCEDRLVCPTCLQERIDIVRKTLDPNTYRAVRATLTKDQTDG